jgi:aryl-alcohol dehydrogenase-like predicted oxidoreductase
MNYRSLGNTGLKVSELGLGCSSIGNSVFNYGEEKEFINLLDFASDNP